MQENGFHGKVAIVTGAAGGIGSAIAHALGTRGARIVLVDRDETALAAQVADLREQGIQAYPSAIDIRHGVAVKAMIERVIEDFGPIDFLVNVAGILRAAPVLSTTEEDWDEHFAVNATGLFHVSQAVARHMALRRRGAIVSVTSNAAQVPRMGMAAYAASKAAATAFTKCLGLELARHGVRCNVVAPGTTRTPMLQSLWKNLDDERRTLDGHPEAFRVGIPLGRIAQPSHTSDAVAFLLSEQASHITMQCLYVDGGAALGA
ncbi:MAG TPA: 2,3-dihydro-2,3-dihydroxybenzoate dehydrogenase [Luteibacter sp.]|jgi:2,3-dihydro-2,3-dihydroxybenzoate dehydrogenase|nr:2,3-dihydro-2,3-dihydroxybenzoate dehydrogenase [Luteibacter sp.]